MRLIIIKNVSFYLRQVDPPFYLDRVDPPRIDQAMKYNKTANEIGSAYGITGATVRRLAKKNNIPGVKIGGSWRFNPSDVEKAIFTPTPQQSDL